MNAIYLITSSFLAILLSVIALRQILNALKRKWDQDRIQTKATQENTKALTELTNNVAHMVERLQAHEDRIGVHESRLNDHESRIPRTKP